MRRWLPVLMGPLAVSLLVACGGGGTNVTRATPAETLVAPTSPVQATQQEVAPVEVTPAVPFTQACQKSSEKQFASPPPRIIDTSKTYIATIMTVKGSIVLQLFNVKPITTNNFVFLACKGFYDGLTFHRVLPGFVAQGGDPKGDGSGGPGYTIPGEFDNSIFVTGIIGMGRRSDPNSAGSQFFIMLGNNDTLDDQYTAFGRVTSGMDVAQSLTPRDPATNPNAPPGDTINTISIQEQ